MRAEIPGSRPRLWAASDGQRVPPRTTRRGRGGSSRCRSFCAGTSRTTELGHRSQGLLVPEEPALRASREHPLNVQRKGMRQTVCICFPKPTRSVNYSLKGISSGQRKTHFTAGLPVRDAEVAWEGPKQGPDHACCFQNPCVVTGAFPTGQAPLLSAPGGCSDARHRGTNGATRAHLGHLPSLCPAHRPSPPEGRGTRDAGVGITSTSASTALHGTSGLHRFS